MAAMPPSEAERIRKETGLSRLEWALRLGVHPTTVLRWEKGERGIGHIEATHIRRTLKEYLENQAQPLAG